MTGQLTYAPSPGRTGGFGFTLGCFLTAIPVGVIGTSFHVHYWDNDAHGGLMEWGLLEFACSNLPGRLSALSSESSR